MHESSNKPYDQIAYAYMGDCREPACTPSKPS